MDINKSLVKYTLHLALTGSFMLIHPISQRLKVNRQLPSVSYHLHSLVVSNHITTQAVVSDLFQYLLFVTQTIGF